MLAQAYLFISETIVSDPTLFKYRLINLLFIINIMDVFSRD